MIENNFSGGFNVSTGKRYMMLLCTWVMCYLIGSLVMGILFYSGMTPVKIRIGMVIQDILMFIVPAMVTAIVITRRPADFLMIRKYPSFIDIIIIGLILVASSPAMNYIIAWNQSLTLPESLRSVQQWMIESEKSVSAMIEMVTGDGSIGGLVISLLLIGVLAGFSEELFFRGAVQRVMVTTPINKHIAVWLTAIIFSSIHLQFFGFFPRLLLGAFFGYLAVWSGSIWLPVIAHILNNSIAVTLMWLKQRSIDYFDIDTIGQGETILIESIAFTALWILLLYLRLTKNKKHRRNNPRC